MPESSQANSENVAHFIRLYTSHEARLRAFALSLVFNYSDAEDVLQQASITLWKKFDTFEPDTNFFAWAGRFVFLEAKQLRKRQAAGKVQFGEEFFAAIAQQTEKAEVAEELAEQEKLLQDCIALLKAEQREVLRLRYEEGGSIDRICEISGRTEQAVYHILSRLRKALFDCVTRKLAAHGGAA